MEWRLRSEGFRLGYFSVFFEFIGYSVFRGNKIRVLSLVVVLIDCMILGSLFFWF